MADKKNGKAEAKEPKKKKVCPISRADFLDEAKPLSVKIGDLTFTAAVKDFSTGSVGWNANQKAEIMVGEVSVPVQIGLNLTCIGSKELDD